jgi:hypothetical protein
MITNEYCHLSFRQDVFGDLGGVRIGDVSEDDREDAEMNADSGKKGSKGNKSTKASENGKKGTAKKTVAKPQMVSIGSSAKSDPSSSASGPNAKRKHSGDPSASDASKKQRRPKKASAKETDPDDVESTDSVSDDAEDNYSSRSPSRSSKRSSKIPSDQESDVMTVSSSEGSGSDDDYVGVNTEVAKSHALQSKILKQPKISTITQRKIKAKSKKTKAKSRKEPRSKKAPTKK